MVFRLALRFVLLAAALPVLAADILLVLHKADNSLGFYDAATAQLVAKVPTGDKPHEFALTADRRLAVVTDYGSDTYNTDRPGGSTLSIVDLAKRARSGVINLAPNNRPHGIERGRSGLFYVTTDFPPALLVVDQKKMKVVRQLAVPGKLPHMVAVTGDERKAWTADAGSGTVSVFDLANRRHTVSIPVGGVPMGFALSADEKRLYVTTRDQDEVVLVDAVANTLRRRIAVKGSPSRLLLSNDGKWLVVSLIGSGEVAVVDTRTLLEVNRIAVGARPEGMTLHPDGDSFYISAQGDNLVWRLSLPDLEKLQEFRTAARPDPLFLLR